MATTRLRNRDTGQQGNGGQFATQARPEARVELVPTPPTAHRRDLTIDPEVAGLTTGVETSFDTGGRTVVAIGIDRNHLPTSDFQVGPAPWEITDEDVTDDQVDAYLEARSDDPEAFAEDIGFDGQARWDSAASTLELVHTGYEGVGDEEMSEVVSGALRDFRNDLTLHDWQ